MERFIAVLFCLLLQSTILQASDQAPEDLPTQQTLPSVCHDIQPNHSSVEATIKAFETSYQEYASDADVHRRNDRLIELVRDMKKRVRQWPHPEDRAVGYYVIVNYDLSLENLALAYYYGLQHLKPEYVNSLPEDFLEGVHAPSIYQVPRTFPVDLPTVVEGLVKNQSKLVESQPGHLHPIEYAAFWQEQPLCYRGPTVSQAGKFIRENFPYLACLLLVKTLAYITSE